MRYFIDRSVSLFVALLVLVFLTKGSFAQMAEQNPTNAKVHSSTLEVTYTFESLVGQKWVEQFLETQPYEKALELLQLKKREIDRNKNKIEEAGYGSLPFMFSEIERNHRQSKNCAAVVSSFNLSFYDYRDAETYPQKDVSALSKVLKHLCELYSQ